MGNSMCKQESPGGAKSGFQSFMSGCSNLCTCPTGLTQKNHYWKKQVQSTRPPYLSSHTASTKWHNATTLTSEQPLKQRNGLLDEPPVPPPRKKRLRRSRSYEDISDMRKDGFKEVFGQKTPKQSISASHSHIYESTTNEEIPIKPFKSSNLKIGNKKTDKFFGENLSDSLSDEPYLSAEEGGLARRRLVDKDQLDIFVEQNVVKAENKLVGEGVTESQEDHLDKKAAFLMTMLDNYNEQDDEERYKGMVPVEEPIIVPKKRITGCICDETDHLLKHLRNEKCAEHGDIPKAINSGNHHEKKDVSTETPPIKPRRDLELYRKSLELKEGDVEKLPSPPTRSKRSMSNSKETLPLLNQNNEASEEKENSNLLTQDLVDHLVTNAYGMTPYMNIEDIHQNSHNDGSQDVSQGISKLKERRRSSNRQTSIDSGSSLNPETPNLSFIATTEENPLFPLSCTDVTVSPLSFKQEPIRFESLHPSPTKDVKDIQELKPIEKQTRFKETYFEEQNINDQLYQQEQEEHQHPQRLANDGVHALEEFIQHQNFNTAEDVLDEIYKHHNSIVFEFQRFLEDELNKSEELEKLKNIDTEDSLKETKEPLNSEATETQVKDQENMLSYIPIDQLKDEEQEVLENETLELVSSASSDISDPSITGYRIKSEKHETTIEPVILNKSDSGDSSTNWFSNKSDASDLSQTQLELVSSSASSDISDASTLRNISDTEDDASSKKLILTNKILEDVKNEGYKLRRKESIEDVENWFTQHLDTPNVNLSQTMLKEDEKKASLMGYDAVKLFPFGEPRERQMSLTDEFFVPKDNEKKNIEPRRSASESRES